MSKTTLTTVIWSKVRADVHKVNPGLAKEIDDIDPSEVYKLLKVCYPFGTDILKSGNLQIPNAAGELVSVHDVSIDNKIKSALTYAPTMPLGVVLNNTLEMYWEEENNIIVWKMMPPGRIFGLWGLMQEPGTSAQSFRMWKISAGSKSLIVLPKISDALNYKRLKKEFGLDAVMPNNLLDQRHLLREIIESSQFNSPWHAELLFFTAPWYKKVRDGSWEKLELYLLKSAWKHTAYLRDEEIFNFVFSRALADKNLKPNPYLTDTVKHIYGIARGCVPGFTVATDDTAAPIRRLEQIFAEVYQHKFVPTFMHLGYFDPTNPLNPVYYSLEVPTLFDFSPKSRKAANKINDLREVKHIQTAIKKFIQENKESLENTPVYDVATKVRYNYYHSENDIFHEVENTNNLIELDENMKRSMQTYGKPICTSSPFLRGCVRIGASADKKK